MKILKTKCDGCCWQLKDKKCYFGKENYPVGNSVFTSGYCKDKRSLDWERDKGIGFALRAFQDETLSSINVALYGNNYTTEALKEAILHYTKVGGIAFHPIVVFHNGNDKIMDETRKILEKTGRRWKMDNILADEFIFDKTSFPDYCMTLADENWVLNAYSNIDKTILNGRILDELISNKNIMGIFYEDNTLYNKDAFMSLGGNYEQPILDKIMGFDNGQDVCIRIV